MASASRSWSATSRASSLPLELPRPDIRIVLGLIPPDIHEREAAFAASVASYNRTISSSAARLSTSEVTHSRR